MESNTKWLLCPKCSCKTRIQIRRDTKIENLPLYCPKCKKKSLIKIDEMKTTVVEEPDA